VPEPESELETRTRWMRRPRHADPSEDTGVHVVVPTGRPGRVTPRLTGSRPAHSTGGPMPRLDRYGWTLLASLVVLVSAAVVIVHTASQPRNTVETRLGNPSALIPLGPDPALLNGAVPPDAGTVPPPAGLPGDGSAPPTGSATSRPATVPGGPPAPANYTAVAGEGCGQTSGYGYFRKGFSSDWRTRNSGGLTTDGCHGAVVAVPMSGDPRKDDNSNVVVWWFATAPVAAGACAVSVFVPDTGVDSDSAGQPAHYLVFGSSNASGPTIGQFDVDQTRNRGRWVSAGRYRTGGHLSVRMVTRGVDFGPGRNGAHLGVSALRAVCTAA
jgi:hypothetical protein